MSGTSDGISTVPHLRHIALLISSVGKVRELTDLRRGSRLSLRPFEKRS